MTENNESTNANPEDTGNNLGEAFIESMQTQAAEAVEAAEAETEAVEAEVAESDAVDSDVTDAEGVEVAEEAPAEDAPAEEAAAEPAEAADAEDAAAEGESDFEADYRRRLRKYTKELKELPGQWFIIQCYSGYENKVKT
ncbi:MAG: transcription termination/antitermination protein NusG, partial [Corynebacterium casei]|nr:transcription termination/antitermination protein NusG [Corynebacterium casei]